MKGPTIVSRNTLELNLNPKPIRITGVGFGLASGPQTFKPLHLYTLNLSPRPKTERSKP